MFDMLGNLRQLLISRMTIGLGGLLAIAFTTLQTIVAAMPGGELPVVSPHQAVDAGRWRVMLHQASISAAPHPGSSARPAGKRSLHVEADILNLSAETSGALGRVFGIDSSIEGLEASPTFYLMRDKAILGALDPGLPERVRIVWTLSDTAQAPAAIRIVISGETFKPRDNLLAAPGWFNMKPVASITLPVVADEGEEAKQ